MSTTAELRARLEQVPARLVEAAHDGTTLPRSLRTCRRLLVTGAGSSAGHARFLVDALAEARPARWRPLTAFAAGPPPDAERDGLIVFSQGLSPNACLALHGAERFRAVVLVTAARNADAATRRRLDGLRERGVCVVDTGADEERGSLVRLAGPVLAYAAALRIAGALEGSPVFSDAEVAAALERGFRRGIDEVGGLPDAAFTGDFLLLGSGLDPGARDNLRLKLAEGLLATVPPVCDLLEFPHGPFQQLYGRDATLLALADPGDPAGAALLPRVAGMLTPAQRLIEVPAALPGRLSVFEHEIWLGCFTLEGMERRGIDAARWPGRGLDEPLYELAAPVAAPASAAAPQPDPARRRLEHLTWPELERLREAGPLTAVIALGSTEQHGPHLPFGTDTWIADALAERFCARVPEAVALPAVPFGCAREHMAFPGTLDLGEDHLTGLLVDLLRSLAHHGFARAYVFSAHGGNVELLRRSQEGLAASAPSLALHVSTDHRRLNEALLAVAADQGVAASAAGLHAGELEASIIAGLAPGALRRAEARPGYREPVDDARALFYPSLRDHAPDGTVGDPTAASAARAERYLETWAELLVADYRARKNAQCTKGTKKA